MSKRVRRRPVYCLLALTVAAAAAAPARAAGLPDVIAQVQPKIVKIYGAGGFQGLEAYQSGMLISAEGHVLTVWSYVLDTDEITVTLDDGRRLKAQLLGADPRLELAVLKIDVTGVAHFELAAAVRAEPGTRVLAFSNLFGVATGDEPASVQHGLVAVKSQLEARRGVFDTTYKGAVYVLDAMTNNPGAPGGALVDYEGRLLAMLGKELRNALSNIWLNYAIPIEEMATTVDEIRTGKFVRKPNDEPNKKPEKALNLPLLGVVLVPDVLERTPPFVDAVRPDSPAALAGLQPDDLVLFVNDRLVQSCKALVGELEFIDRVDAVKVTVIRGQDLVDVTLSAPPEDQQDAMQRMTSEQSKCTLPCVAVMAAALLSSAAQAQQNLPRLEEQAMRAAVERVAPSVVKIETVGGLERIGKVLVGTGPTTGLIVSGDGYIVSSAFNFAQKPSSILVGLPDGTRTPARLVATDHQRMLVLLKITVDELLPVPQAVPENEIHVGQWAIAVGRTFDGREPNVSAGIVSGLNRIWGKAIQTDAKVSPANYGGPLLDIRGRVLGVLVPLSPTSTEDVAGVEWYDSGIGFAVPLAHVNSVLPKLTQGVDLKPGIIGVSLNGRDMYTKPPVIVACRPNSPAYKAGLKAGDRIVEIDGTAIERQAQLRQQINRRYAGDTIHVAVLRGDERIERDIPLVDQLDPYARPFLGILPRRDAPADAGGVVVRYVYPESPAAQAGVRPGDTIVSVDGQAVAGRDALVERVSGLEIAEAVKIDLRRAGEALAVELLPAAEPTAVPAELPPAREGNAAAPEGDRPQVGQFPVKVPEFKNECTAYVPEAYNPQVPHGLVVWLHPPGPAKDEELLARWKEPCDRLNLILLAPRSGDPARWMPPEVDFVAKTIDHIREHYNVDPQRVIVHGHQAGGSLAYVVAFAHRDVVRGVAAVDAPILGRPPENEPTYRLSFFVTAAKKANFAEQINAGIEQLHAMKYAVTVEDQGDAARYLDDAEFAELLRWIDSLDKI